MSTEPRKLASMTKNLWANAIIWRLADAMDMIKDDASSAFLDVDEVLEKAEEMIYAYRDLQR